MCFMKIINIDVYKRQVLTLLLSLAVVYGPMMIAEYLPYKMQKALDLIPLVGSSTDTVSYTHLPLLSELSQGSLHRFA